MGNVQKPVSCHVFLQCDDRAQPFGVGIKPMWEDHAAWTRVSLRAGHTKAYNTGWRAGDSTLSHWLESSGQTSNIAGVAFCPTKQRLKNSPCTGSMVRRLFRTSS